MIKSLWTAKTGLESQQVKMDVISNNLANVSTNGFKKSRAVFEDLLYQNLRQPGGANDVQNTLPSGMQVGSGVRPVATERLHSQGGLENTGNSRDLAINGKGFFSNFQATASHRGRTLPGEAAGVGKGGRSTGDPEIQVSSWKFGPIT